MTSHRVGILWILFFYLLLFEQIPAYASEDGAVPSTHFSENTQFDEKLPKSKKFESYLVRPSILEMKGTPLSESSASWESMKRAHLEGIAQLLEMYPEHHLYFLARDSELFFDFAKIVTADSPEESSRIHLLNISRINMNQPGIQEYLTQEGISETSLRSGMKVLFVDTGFAGTIPTKILDYFPKDLHSQLQTQLIVSSNPSFPSSRTFLAALNPAAASVAPSGMHGTLVDYELMPRYTDRSHSFKQISGK